MMTEYERASQGRPAPDGEAWNRQLYKVRLFNNLIHNVDRHMDNMLITEDWQVYLIDHSRTFRRRTELRTPDDLKRFSRSLLLVIGLLDEGDRAEIDETRSGRTCEVGDSQQI